MEKVFPRLLKCNRYQEGAHYSIYSTIEWCSRAYEMYDSRESQKHVIQCTTVVANKIYLINRSHYRKLEA